MDSSTYVIRRGTHDDALALREIRLEALRDTPDAYGSTYEAERAWSHERWRRAAREWAFFLAERDEQVVGMVSGGLNVHVPETHWMYAMYVSPPFRGSGVALGLVEATCHWASERGASMLYLQVTETVARAQAFYVKCGFEETGVTITMDRDRSLRLMTMVKSLA